MRKSGNLTIKDLQEVRAIMEKNGWDVRCNGNVLECKTPSRKISPGSTGSRGKANPLTRAKKIDPEPSLSNGGLF
jgi:hypothetical protein